MSNFDRAVVYSLLVVVALVGAVVAYQLATWPALPAPSCSCELGQAEATPPPVPRVEPAPIVVAPTERIVRVETIVSATVVEGVNVRAAASGQSDVVGSIAAGDVVRVIAVEGSWWRVVAGAVTGWVYSDFLTLTAIAEE